MERKAMSEYIEVFKRIEIKYLLSDVQYRELNSYLKTMARVDDYGLTRINNIYFDTPNYKMIRTSLEKPVYKEKLRLRTYGNTDDETNSFIEIKKKYAGVVYKRRVSGTYKAAYDYLVNGGEALDDSQISKEIEGLKLMYDELIPSMKISYDRVAMAGINDPNLRITFDSNIEWTVDDMSLKSKNSGNAILDKNNYLMEIKVANSMPQALAKRLSELGIYPASFSKYGRGYEDMISRNYYKNKILPICSLERSEESILVYI
jgi:SPX domain protein involved in polyphosphate accumulation